MSRFQVLPVDGKMDSLNQNSSAGIDNPAMDPVELNVHGLYAKRNSITCPAKGGTTELKRKSSYGFTHITRCVLHLLHFTNLPLYSGINRIDLTI